MSRENDIENMDTAIEQTAEASGQTEAEASLGTVTESDVNASEESGEKSG